jgi:hypothetical protein
MPNIPVAGAEVGPIGSERLNQMFNEEMRRMESNSSQQRQFLERQREIM